MIVDNGAQMELVIPGVFDGLAGVARGRLWFVPTSTRADPSRAVAGLLSGKAIRIAPVKDEAGAGWSSRYEVMA